MPASCSPLSLSCRPALKPLVVALGAAFAVWSMPAARAAETEAEGAALSAVTVQATPTRSEFYQLPSTTESVTRSQLEETVNVMNTEDALKYLPSVMVRKRHIGDTYAPVTSRTSGPGQSARSLIYADGVLLSALIGNNNGAASPRWGMVAPEEIERIDVLYGPFSAAYAGNSMGVVVDMATRMPDKLEAGITLGTASQKFSQYGTRDRYQSDQISAVIGSREGAFSWWLSANHLDSESNPISFVTLSQPSKTSSSGTPVSGAYAARDKYGNPIQVIGAGGLEQKQQDNFKIKLAYDFAPGLQLAYSLGQFRNAADSHLQSYLRNASGAPVYSGSINIGGYAYTLGTGTLASGAYQYREEHTMHSLALRSRERDVIDWELIASKYDFGTDQQRTAGSVSAALNGNGAGTNTLMDGTGWYTLDFKGRWKPAGVAEPTHVLSFGAHYDEYTLASAKYNLSNWLYDGQGTLSTEAAGKTHTTALWLQDVWRLAPGLDLTLGGRSERWAAVDGYNYSASPALRVDQPELHRDRFSPKASLAWALAPAWQATASVGQAYRFPTVTELYQAVSTNGGTSVTVPNPDLRPEAVLAGELALERTSAQSRVRLSLFQEELKDALLSQSAPLVPGSTTLYSYIQNVDRVRSRGAELVFSLADLGVRGLDLGGSLTYVDSRIIEDGAFPAAVGKATPNIPRWRGTAQLSWRPNERWTTSLAARYSDRLWTTLDNTDINTHTYTGFEHYFVVDARVNYRVNKQWSTAFGVDNLNNQHYFLYHPFPQRTLFAQLKFNY